MRCGSDAERLRRMVESDADGAIKNILRVAQCDVMTLLSEFMDVARLDMSVNKNGDGFTLDIKADVNRFYGIGMCSLSAADMQ